MFLVAVVGVFAPIPTACGSSDATPLGPAPPDGEPSSSPSGASDGEPDDAEGTTATPAPDSTAAPFTADATPEEPATGPIVVEGDPGPILVDDTPPPNTVPPEGVRETVESMVTEDCANTEVVAVDQTTFQPADIVFAIDTSGTMKEELGFIQDNMNQFSQQIVDSGIDVRVIMIASPFDPESPIPENLGICIDAPLGSGNCPDDDNLPGYAHVPRHVPGYNGLNAFIDTYDQWSTNLRPEASKSIVVISDDNASYPPNDSAAAFTTNLQALDPEMWASWTFSGIFAARECEATATIGTAYIDLVAQTGGVGGELCDQEFQPVFDRLAEQIVTSSSQEIACEWAIPTPPEGQSLSIDLVHVERSSDLDGTALLDRVDSEAECTDAAWHFDDPFNPTRILACPDTCAAIQDQRGGRITVSFGCQVIEGCAESGAALLEVGTEFSCELPLPPPPAGVTLDVSTINVRYDTELGFFGILGTVASETECTEVAEGWYYDDPEKPTSVVLCPQSCDAYRAGAINDVQAVFGCDVIEARPKRVK